MPKKLVRRGRVKGYRPTHSQLQEILKIAQKDFDDTSEAYLVYSQGDLEISPQANIAEILPRHVDEIIKEAGDPHELNNLVFSISQSTPMQRVELRVGVGNWTTYRVESDDQTWAYGRYHELTDKLLSDRSLYAKFRSSQPEVLKESTDDKWRATVWEVHKDWRELGTAIAASIPWWPAIGALVIATSIALYAPTPSNATEKQAHKQALQAAHSIGAHAAILVVLALLYMVTLLGYRHWLHTFLRSKIILRKPSLISQFSFRGGKSDTIGLASFYVAVLTLIATAIAIILSLVSRTSYELNC